MSPKITKLCIQRYEEYFFKKESLGVPDFYGGWIQPVFKYNTADEKSEQFGLT